MAVWGRDRKFIQWEWVEEVETLKIEHVALGKIPIRISTSMYMAMYLCTSVLQKVLIALDNLNSNGSQTSPA